jgi:alginate O-acetyltransferase complex protein AlgI
MTVIDYPRWLVMWLVAGTIFLGCKGLTWWSAPCRGPVAAWFAWPGLDAASFFATNANVCPPAAGEWSFAAAKTALGASFFWLAGSIETEHDLVRGWLGMIGVVFVLHFGLFHLLSCLWRKLGYNAAPIMNHPWAATSLSDFWGRRWNRAFRDLAHRHVFRPLAKTLPANLALLAGFAVSGMLHEIVITVPAGGGYGGPTLYFCLQGLGIAFEHSRLGKTLNLAKGRRGWLLAGFVVLGPVALLFPPVFIRNIVVPMMDALGAA